MINNNCIQLEIPSEYQPLCEDLLRMFSIQIMVNFLLVMTHPAQYSLLGIDFFKTFLYISVGISLYWLVIRKLICFKSNNKKSVNFWYGGT